MAPGVTVYESHFGTVLSFLLRKKPAWREMMKTILFTKGDIVAKGEEAED